MKVGSIVEEATRIGNRSGKSSEDERREVEEKVDWIFHTRFLNICSGGEARQVRGGGEGEAVQLVLEQEQEVNLRPDHPGSIVLPSSFLDSANVCPVVYCRNVLKYI